MRRNKYLRFTRRLVRYQYQSGNLLYLGMQIIWSKFVPPDIVFPKEEIEVNLPLFRWRYQKLYAKLKSKSHDENKNWEGSSSPTPSSRKQNEKKFLKNI